MRDSAKGLVFFDLDGTILGGRSSENAFCWYLLRKGWMNPRRVFLFVLFLLRWFWTYKWTVVIKNKAYLSGLSVERVEKLAERFVHDHLIGKIRPSIRAVLNKHQQQGDVIVLLTGSPYFLAHVIARYLQISLVESTRCDQQDGRFTWRPPHQNPFSKSKVTVARRVCEKHQVLMERCAAYGNSIHDHHILECVGMPVAVTPDRWLRRLANKRGWRIID